jgi:hypothetical protein
LPTVVRVADNRAFGERGAQIGGLPELVGLERDAEPCVDLVESVLAEIRQEVLR